MKRVAIALGVGLELVAMGFQIVSDLAYDWAEHNRE